MSLDDPLISVVVPAWNAAATLPATLATARAQAGVRIEIIVVDDGSNDATAAIVEAAGRADPRVRLVRQSNAGVAAARNRGFAEAGGELIAPLDADDLWHPEKLARQLDRLRETPAAGMVYCWSTYIDEDDRIVEHPRDVDRFEGNVLPALIVANFIGNGSVPLIRRDLLTAAGGWDPLLRARDAQGCEDWQLYLRLAALAPVVLAPAYLVGYRQRAGAMSRGLDAMTRSYRIVLADARAAHPRLPDRLFRWSRSAFHAYASDLAWEAGDIRRAFGFAVRTVADDPAWLLRPSTRRRYRSRLRSGIRLWAGGRDRPKTAPVQLSPPLGQRFGEVAPDHDYGLSEGVVVAKRREWLAELGRSPRHGRHCR